MQLVGPHNLNILLGMIFTNAWEAPYATATNDTAAGLSSAAFMNTYGELDILPIIRTVWQTWLAILAFLFITMAVLMFIFMVCATRTNIVYTLIFLSLLIVFLLLSSAYWLLGEGSAATGDRCVKVIELRRAEILSCLELTYILILTFRFRGLGLHSLLQVYLAFTCWLFSCSRLWNSHSIYLLEI